MATSEKKNTWVKKVLDKYTPVGVVKQLRGYGKDLRARDESITEASQLKYKQQFGERMSPSYLKADMEAGGFLSKKSRDYLKIKKQITKEVT